MLIDALNKLKTHPNPDEMREIVFDIENAFVAEDAVGESSEAELSGRMSRQALMQKVRVGAISFDAAFASFCEAERPQDCIWALAERLALPEPLVNGNFRRPESDRFAILCRAADISDATYTEFAQMRLALLGRPNDEIGRLIREYAEICATQARQAVRAVRTHLVRIDPQAALALSA